MIYNTLHLYGKVLLPINIQGETDRSVHTSLYHPARLPLYPAHFGVVNNYIVSPNNRRSSVLVYNSRDCLISISAHSRR